MKSIIVKTPTLNDLEIQYTDAFLDVIRRQLGLAADAPVDDHLIIEFFGREIESGVIKAESGASQEANEHA